ncbi:bromodomain and WD repeat-containing protein 3-like isoform X2 [Platichthys flesus]|uniref:bromodomain and WD repeat-containing protein 3-like isoform X2 n=1 Tax=Platichthys flesus TaxID=8260 RepID=UPI002DBC3E77|nr:bromodomain and WD repeat-containing protein 3-like isoform X2 [Platichthys flesus]
MAARSRITVLLLLFLLSTEHSFAVNLNELEPLVKELLSKYRAEGVFSLAVSIPLNQNQNQDQNLKQGAYQIQKVLESDPAANVENKINNGEVYVGSRVVAAKPGGGLHAESRVVDKLNQLYNSPQFNQDDLLLFYVYASPCVEQCTDEDHPLSILRGLNEIRRWNNWAVVFSKIFKPRIGQENTDMERVRALRRLATYGSGKTESDLGPIGLQNIFRCDYENQQMKCVSCSSDGQVAQTCVSDGPQSGRGGSSSQGGAQANRNPGRGGSSSQGGAQDGWLDPKKGKGDRVRRDISYNTGDSSAHISESNKGAEDAPSVDENGNDVATGESVSLSPTGSDEGNGGDLRTVVDVLTPHIGFDSGDGRVSKGKGKVSKGKGGKGRRKKGKGKRRRGKGKGKGRRVKGGKRRRGKGKGRRGKGGRGGKGKKSRRGGRSRRRGLDQDWIFASDF